MKYYDDNSQQNCHKIGLLGISERENNVPIHRWYNILCYEWDIVMGVSSKIRVNIYQNDLHFIFYSTYGKMI